MEVMEVRGSRLTDLSCLEERASLAERGRSPREPGEVRWELRGEASQGGGVVFQYSQPAPTAYTLVLDQSNSTGQHRWRLLSTRQLCGILLGLRLSLVES